MCLNHAFLGSGVKVLPKQKDVLDRYLFLIHLVKMPSFLSVVIRDTHLCN